MTTHHEQHDTNLIRSVLTSEVKWVIALATFVVTVVAPYYSIKESIALIQQDISTINTNHEAHIQDILTRMEKGDIRDSERDKQIIELQKQMIVLINNK